MRKALSIIGLLFAAMIAQVAHANPTYVYTYTLSSPGYDLTWTTDPIAAVTGQTQIFAANLASYSVTGSNWAGYALYSAIIDEPNCSGLNSCQVTQFTSSSCLTEPGCFESDIFSTNDGLTLAEYSTPGTYTSNAPIEVLDYTCCGASFVSGTTSLTVSAVSPTPEPASIALFGTGLFGIGFIIRKRLFAFGQEHSPTA